MANHLEIVYVDVDGVLVEHNRRFLEILNQTIGTTYGYEHLTTFDYHDCLPPEHADILLHMWQGETLYDGWPPEPGAMEAVEEMRRFARVIALSSPMLGHIASKYRWLLEWGFGRKDIFFATDKSLARGAVLIDDRTKNLLDFEGVKICFPRPWNWDWNPADGLKTDNWDEIVAEVREVIQR